MKNLFDEEIDLEVRRCNRCKIDKVFSEFGKENKRKMRSWCRQCDKEMNKERLEIRKNAPPIPKNHICPICHRNENQIKETMQYHFHKGSYWVCDHNHKKKTFRGWICKKCNLALGNFNDDIRALENAIDWIKKHE